MGLSNSAGVAEGTRGELTSAGHLSSVLGAGRFADIISFDLGSDIVSQLTSPPSSRGDRVSELVSNKEHVCPR